MSSSAYARVALSEDAGEAAEAQRQPPPKRLVQWCLLAILTAFASGVLAVRVARRATAPSTASMMVNVANMNGSVAAAPAQSARRRGRHWQYAMTMGRHGTSSSFVMRTRRRSIKKQAAKAATRSVVLIGSHFGAGNDLLKRVFGELCQRSRLALRCEPTWGLSLIHI